MKTNRLEANDMSRSVLGAAHAAWTRLAEVRQRRRRHLRYTYGDQWSDPATDRNGNLVTERQALTVSTRPPLTNNLIRRLVKTVVGRYRLNNEAADGNSDDAAAANGALEELKSANQLDELDSRTLEEFLISGIAVHRIWRETRHGGSHVWVDPVAPDTFFINNVADPRCTDMELVGRLLSLSRAELLARFGRGDRQRIARLSRLYDAMESKAVLFESDSFGVGAGGEDPDFFRAPSGRCRVVEVWTLEYRRRIYVHDPVSASVRVLSGDATPRVNKLNRRRGALQLAPLEIRPRTTTAWHCRMMAPDGTLLDEFDSPLPGSQVPFVVKLYPLIDGDVHSLVEDVIDQQRYVNTLITLMDRMMGTAAKGVLLFPLENVPKGMKLTDIANRWGDPGGVLPYVSSPKGCEPKQMVTSMSDFGAQELLKTHINLIEDISGVNSALMGKAAGAGVGVERFESEVRNSEVAVLDLLRTFRHFVDTRNALALSLVHA